MVAHINTVAFQGIEARDIDVQVSFSSGLPSFTIIGLPDKAEQNRASECARQLALWGLSLPPKRITVNLAPADILKEGRHFDLPIALGLLVAMDVIGVEDLSEYAALGELGLDGALIPVAGVLLAAVEANANGLGLICPEQNGAEAVWAGGDDVLGASSLLALVNHFQIISPPAPAVPVQNHVYPDLRDIKGQEVAKRSLEVAAAGAHDLLLIGPPGSGKSMLAQHLPGILPPLEVREALTVSMIASVTGLLRDGVVTLARPFRDPHHSASMPALVGGGVRAKPGEVSLAHQGVLFLDELPEFSCPVLDALRQPTEIGKISIARANAHVSYPARFQLIAAMNPCRCGYLSDPERACARAPRCAREYQSRISGPLYDRIDLHVDVPELSAADLSLPPPAKGSAEIAARVARARAIQRARYQPLNDEVRTNTKAEGKLLDQVAMPDASGTALLTKAVDKMKLSARGYHRVMRVARTLADFEGADRVGRLLIAEALSYRRISNRVG